jgi:hypothetical protein
VEKIRVGLREVVQLALLVPLGLLFCWFFFWILLYEGAASILRGAASLIRSARRLLLSLPRELF